MRRPRTIALLGLGLLTLALHSTCGGNPSTPSSAPPPSSAVSLQISGPTTLTGPGQTGQLIATASFQDGRQDVVTSRAEWNSDDPSIATISAGGLLTGVGYGVTQVSAYFDGNSSGVEVRVLPNGTFVLTGNITEAVGLPIDGAAVSLKGGTVTGPRSVTTESGFYRFAGVAGAITIGVTHSGYVREDSPVTISRDTVVDIELAPNNPPANIAGVYQLNIAASGSCSGRLPAAARSRTYRAEIDQAGAGISVTLSGADFIETGGGYTPPRLSNAFSGRVVGTHVTFDLFTSAYDFYNDQAYAVAERVGNQYLAISGTAETTATVSKISGSLAGAFDLFNSPPAQQRPDVTCTAGNHRFMFTK